MRVALGFGTGIFMSVSGASQPHSASHEGRPVEMDCGSCVKAYAGRGEKVALPPRLISRRIGDWRLHNFLDNGRHDQIGIATPVRWLACTIDAAGRNFLQLPLGRLPPCTPRGPFPSDHEVKEEVPMAPTGAKRQRHTALL